ncbi:tRNA-intron lyase [Malassezia psittaci]|uniref:tRNA-splicing endonuclease subunit Sen34 n=1 Tax=Malassezia psittaci TaxID=1821823 RepID=A0AAF0FCD1_9BASI|nr:tRNA-intron lyase [Malassezia psittaci]
MEELRKAHPGRVPILLANGVPFLWEPQDVELVRTKHNLCGLLSGTLPLIPQQNVFLGLPLRLLPEEVVLLLRRKAAILIDEKQAYVSPNDESKVEYLKQKEQLVLEQKEEQRKQQEDHRQRVEAALVGEAGDVKALERRRARQVAKALQDTESLDNKPEANEQEDALLKMPYLHHTPNTSAEIPGYIPTLGGSPSKLQNAYLTLQSAQAAGIWTYPSTLAERARCAVFESLHSDGYFLSTGLRFGGDFVVYPGDPLRYHSHYTATVLSTPKQPMAAFHVIASGRLGTAVKKSHLICQANTLTLDDDVALERRLAGLDDALDSDQTKPWGNVEYWSLAWAGFGT